MNNIYEIYKSGFVPQHSVATALVKVINDQLLASDQGCDFYLIGKNMLLELWEWLSIVSDLIFD